MKNMKQLISLCLSKEKQVLDNEDPKVDGKSPPSAEKEQAVTTEATVSQSSFIPAKHCCRNTNRAIANMEIDRLTNHRKGGAT